MTKRAKTKPVALKMNAYWILEDAIGQGLGFALNRLQDAGVEMTDEQREAAKPAMMNEIMCYVSEVVDFDRC